MIAIVNTQVKGQPGHWIYEVKINHHSVARFQHNRQDGLEVCLRQAAEAVKVSLKTGEHHGN